LSLQRRRWRDRTPRIERHGGAPSRRAWPQMRRERWPSRTVNQRPWLRPRAQKRGRSCPVRGLLTRTRGPPGPLRPLRGAASDRRPRWIALSQRPLDPPHTRSSRRAACPIGCYSPDASARARQPGATRDSCTH
jgi:hypothetical protein